MTITDGLPPLADLITELDGLDEDGRHDRIHVVIRQLATEAVGIQQRYRNGLAAKNHIGKRDFGSALAEAKRELAACRTNREADTRYHVGDDGFLYMDDEAGRVLLAKFLANITAEVVRDDGTEKTRLVRFEVHGPDGKSGHAEVPVDRVHKAREWSTKAIGATAVIMPGRLHEEHVGVATQIRSEGAWEQVVEYTHTGWRVIEDEHRFLTASGGIGTDGLDDTVRVNLGNPRLNNYRLPDPSAVDIDDLRAAVRMSLDLLDVAPAAVMVPLLAATYRAPLPLHPDTSVFVVGPSGSMKTTVSALTLQHFGAGLDAKNVPAEWKSTANAIETMAYSLANVVFLVDDYAPQSVDDPKKLGAIADRVLRGSANHSGRERLKPDGTPRPSYPPRAQMAATGEDVPPGHSLRARLTITECTADMVDRPVLTLAQKRGGDGAFALAMAGYVQWLAGEQEKSTGYAAALRSQQAELRSALAGEGHLRAPEAAASLLLGWREWLRYAGRIGAVDEVEAHRLIGVATKTLSALAAEQAIHTVQFSPTTIYLSGLRAALVSGDAHVDNQQHGGPPSGDDSMRAWGWQPPGPVNSDARPNGRAIGWLSPNGELFIDAGSAYAVAVDQAKKANASLGTSKATMSKRLRDEGLLAEEGKGQVEVVRRILGKSRRVLALHAHLLVGDEPAEAVAA